MDEGEPCDIVVMDDVMSPESASRLSAFVSGEILKRGHSKETANKASLFTEEIIMNGVEYNKKRKRRPHVEITLLFSGDGVRLIERDNGEIIDSTNPNMRIDGVSSYVLSQIMKHHEKKLYLTTTGYNRSILDFGNPA